MKLFSRSGKPGNGSTPSPLPPSNGTTKHAIFESKFADEEILAQLTNRDYNLKLEEHNWEGLKRRGPCVFSLAEEIIRRGAKTKKDAEAVLAEALKKKGGKAPSSSPSDTASVSSYVTANSSLSATNYDDMASATLQSFRRIAESYLDRSPTRKSDAVEEEVCIRVVSRAPSQLKGGQKKCYMATQLLARGSAGLIYAGTDAADEEVAEEDEEAGTTRKRQRALVLKKIFETQRESAENEFQISQKLKTCDSCLKYLDSGLDEEGNLWLVLPRVKRTKYGVDLKEYLTKGFFQSPDIPHRTKQLIVIQLLRGLREASLAGVVLRDVKPDNVLLDPIHSTFYFARWSDFGLAVDLNNLRSVYDRSTPPAAAADDDAVLNWWYDTLKLVPRPKWVFRRPPERCFQDPSLVPASSFDIYMFGIVCISCALGVDLPHIDDPSVRDALEKALGRASLNELGADDKAYLKTFDPGNECRTNIAILNGFKRSFGDDFGTELFEEVVRMLDPEPKTRPTPGVVLTRLTGRENGEEKEEAEAKAGGKRSDGVFSKGFEEFMLCSCAGGRGEEGGGGSSAECRLC